MFFSRERVIPLPEETPVQKISKAFLTRAFPTDLILVIIWLAASIAAIYLPFLYEIPVRYVLTIPVVLFIPGYCLIIALFPREDDISLLERIALSLGLSIAIVSFIGLGLNFTPLGIRLESILISLTLFTLVMVLIAFIRRALLASEERFRIPFSAIVSTIRNAMFPKDGRRVDRLIMVVLTFAILAAVILTIYVIAVPKEGERFTEFFILGDKQKAADYPDRISIGQDYPLYIGVGNHEYRNVTYTIETWVMNMEFDTMTNTSRIIVMDPLWQRSLTLAHNKTMTIPYNLSVEKNGYNRVEFLLFNETVPGSEVTGSDRINASYRDLHLWVTIRTG
jgi:uncharacterized membrane protein